MSTVLASPAPAEFGRALSAASISQAALARLPELEVLVASAAPRVGGATAFWREFAWLARGLREPAAEVDDTAAIAWRFDECFVYRVPTAADGRHQAQSWDLGSPAATCHVRVLTQDETLSVQLWQSAAAADAFFAGDAASKRALVAQVCMRPSRDADAPEAYESYFVSPVVDSQRYFVLRAPGGRLLGIGFRDRGPASEFRTTVVDHFRYVWR